MKEGNEVIVYLVSDSVGETAQKVFSAVIAQFPNMRVKEVKRFPFTSDMESLLPILKDALADDGIVVTTLVNQHLVKAAADFCKENEVAHIELMSDLMGILERKAGISPMQAPGAVHQLNREYFSRVEAIEFAVRYDDGKEPRGFKDADFVLIGISRTSKTPLSMYLANKNFKVANLPLIPEVPVPRELYEIPRRKIIGLTTSIESLLQIRRARLKAFGMKEESSYTDVTRIQEELAYADELFRQLGIIPINVHNRAIEETAMIIELAQNKSAIPSF